MPTRLTLLALTLCTASLAAQEMPNMPGMTMPPQQPNQTPNPPDPKAPDLQHAPNPRARAAQKSMQHSEAQQAAPPPAKPAPASDRTSLQLPIQELQEPEAVGFQTGADLPAPELLREIAAREPMTFAAFLTLADTHNPTLKQAQSNIERSNQQARQAGLPPDPLVGYSGDHIRGGSYHGGEQGAFFSQEFVLGHKLALRRDIYRAEGRANQYAAEAQLARVHDDVGRAFFDALTAQEMVVVHDRLLKVALDAETNAHELERVGQADASDVLTAEVAAEQAKIDFVDAQRAFLSSFAQLATFAGQPALPPHPLTGSLVEPPDLDPEATVASDTDQSPTVKQAQANVFVAEARVKDARRERIPNLNLKAGEWYSGEELNNTGKAGWESFAEAGFQLPLWNRNQGNTAAAQAELDRARQDVLRQQLLTRNRTEPLAQQYLAARFTVERYRTEMLPRARRAYQLQVTKYQQMALAYPPVLAAQRMLFTLQLSYLHALNDEWRTAIALQNYALTDALDAPMSTGDDTTTLNLPTGENP